jgi:hypothetical protein
MLSVSRLAPYGELSIFFTLDMVVSWLERGSTLECSTAPQLNTPPISARCCSPRIDIGRSGATATLLYFKWQRVPEALIWESSFDLHVVSDHPNSADGMKSLSPDADMDPFRLYVPVDDDCANLYASLCFSLRLGPQSGSLTGTELYCKNDEYEVILDSF